jgi:hypothetical protein
VLHGQPGHRAGSRTRRVSARAKPGTAVQAEDRPRRAFATAVRAGWHLARPVICNSTRVLLRPSARLCNVPKVFKKGQGTEWLARDEEQVDRSTSRDGTFRSEMGGVRGERSAPAGATEGAPPVVRAARSAVRKLEEPRGRRMPARPWLFRGSAAR